MSKVGVIIVNWNSGDLLRRCVAAIAAQTRAPDRVIVVDNASGDGSLETAQQAYPDYEYIRNTDNTGFARANNQAVERCGDCDWICLLNPDAFAEPDWLANLLQAAAEHPDLSVFASLVLKSGGDTVDSAGDSFLASGIAVHRLAGHDAKDPVVTRACEVFAPCAAAAMYRREAFLRVGGFDESFFAYYEDVDLGFRLRLQGYRCGYVPGAVVRHVGAGTTGGEGNPLSNYYGQRNLILTYVKNMPGALFWRFLPRHLWAVLKGVGKGLVQGRGWLVLRATGAAVRRLPACLQRRREIQRSRRVRGADLFN
jgi:GT2 family glycosyltransferase